MKAKRRMSGKCYVDKKMLLLLMLLLRWTIEACTYIVYGWVGEWKDGCDR